MLGQEPLCLLTVVDSRVPRLADDHANALSLARALAQAPGLALEMPETNLVFIDTTAAGVTADELAHRLRQQGVLISVMGPYRARACTHLDVSHEQIVEAAAAIRSALG